MKTLTETEALQSFLQSLPSLNETFQHQIEELKNSTESYLSYISQEELLKKTTQNLEEEIDRKEGLLDKLKMIVEKRNEMIEKGKETINQFNEMIKSIETSMRITEGKEEILENAQNQLIDEIIIQRRVLLEEKTAPLKKQIEEMELDFEKRKNELLKDYTNKATKSKQTNQVTTKQMNDQNESQKRKYEDCVCEESFPLINMKRKKLPKCPKTENVEEKEKKENIIENKQTSLSINSGTKTQQSDGKKREEKEKKEEVFLNESEIKQLQIWTNRKCDAILFDSEKDDWNSNTSVFDKKIFGKTDLIFVVEDINGNKFGAYIHSRINQYDTWIYDKNSFLFTLQSNQQMKNGMIKFEIQKQHMKHACYLYQQSDAALIAFGTGHTIHLNKEERKEKCLCYQNNVSYNYHLVSNAFIPNCLNNREKFTPKRIIVVETK